MGHLERVNVRNNRVTKWAALSLATLVAATLAGCTTLEKRGYIPGGSDPGVDPVTNHSGLMTTFWVNSWIVLLVVGMLVWTLLIWALIAYRRRKNEQGLPNQLRYHMPIEILFSVTPIILVGVFFAFTARSEAAIEENWTKEQTEVHIEVYGKQWSWDFNYLEVPNSKYEGDAWFSGVQAIELRNSDGKTTGEIDENKLPMLYLPVGAHVKIDLKSRDVAHSFWIPEFVYKEDNIPGQTNHFSFIPEREGTYIGKCAELCGEYHSMMLFQVKVVSQAEYNKYIEDLKAAGNVGRHGDEYNRFLNLPGTSEPDTKHS